MSRTIKTIIIIACIMLFVSSPGHARLRIGLSGGYSLGGDIGKSKAVIGTEIEIPLQAGFGVMLSTSAFSDEFKDEGVLTKQDLRSWGASIVYRKPIKPLEVLFGAGVTYNVPRVTATIDPAVYGTDARMIVDADSAFGICLTGGLSIPLSDHWDIFTAYTYNLVELPGTVTLYMPGTTLTDRVRMDYDHGVLKAGVSYLF